MRQFSRHTPIAKDMAVPEDTQCKVPTSRIEEYLESIINLFAEGKQVLAARLAERLELAPATVSATLRRMVRDGLILVKKNKEISLTDKGRQEALRVLRRHRLAEKLLFDILGVEWHELHDEACLLEHAISARVEERMDLVLKNPACCPHGNPIPNGDSLPSPKGIPLSSSVEGASVIVERITEETTRNPKLMKYFFDIGVVPGASFNAKKVDPYAGTIVLSSGRGREVTLSLSSAEVVWVTPK